MAAHGKTGLLFVSTMLALAHTVGAATNTSTSASNELRWAHIVLEEQMFPSAGFLAMVSAFTDGGFRAPVRDDAVADIPWGTPALGGPTTMAAIRAKYGPPNSTTTAPGTVAQTLQRKSRRAVQYHWYGAVAFITEVGSDNLTGLAFRGDLLKQLSKQPDLKLAAEQWLEGVRKSALQSACQEKLRQLTDAKRRWARDTGRSEGDTPFAVHIVDYLPGATMPECPEQGTYKFNLVGQKPECSVHSEKSPNN